MPGLKIFDNLRGFWYGKFLVIQSPRTSHVFIIIFIIDTCYYMKLQSEIILLIIRCFNMILHQHSWKLLAMYLHNHYWVSTVPRTKTHFRQFDMLWPMRMYEVSLNAYVCCSIYFGPLIFNYHQFACGRGVFARKNNHQRGGYSTLTHALLAIYVATMIKRRIIYSFYRQPWHNFSCKLKQSRTYFLRHHIREATLCGLTLLLIDIDRASCQAYPVQE